MQIDWWTLAIQTINFLVVVWLLSRFLYRPVRRMIDAREAADRAAAEAAQQKAEEADKLRAEYDGKLAAFEDEQRKRESELHQAMQREREETLAAAQKEADEIRANARAEMEEAHDRAFAGLRDEIAVLARDLAGKALTGASPDPAKALGATLEQQDEAALMRMRKDLAAGGTLTIVTAEEQPEETRARIRATLAKRFADGARVTFETEAALLGGVILRLPHGVLDASVAGRLDDAARKMTEGGDDA